MGKGRVLGIGLAVVAVAAAGYGAYRLVAGDGGAPPTLTRATPPASPAEPVDPKFCEGISALDKLLAQAPADPKLVGQYVAKAVTPTVATIRKVAPGGRMAPQVDTVLATVEKAATTGDAAAFDSPAFAAAQGTMYPYVADTCHYQKIEATAGDNAFTGIPAQLKAGRSVLMLHNKSGKKEYHEIAFVKVTDAKVPLKQFMALPEGNAKAMIDPDSYGIGAFAGPGETSGQVVDLTPGRWVYACFVPAGTTDAKPDGAGPPHAMAGMYGEVTVR
jgi:uncharacterized cupredoxin-like copper-binding protein